MNLIFYKCLPSHLSPLIKSYVISTTHAIICVVSVINYLFKHEMNFNEINRIIGGGVDGTGDEMMVYNICLTCGYLFYDFLLMLIHKEVRTNGALVHHAIIFSTFFCGLTFRIGHRCHFFLLAEELSTIPLNFKAFYRHSPRLHQLFSLLFVISFLFIRILFGSIVCGYVFVAAPQFFRLVWNANDMTNFYVGFLQLFLCLLSRFLNFYWAILILKKVFSGK